MNFREDVPPTGIRQLPVAGVGAPGTGRSIAIPNGNNSLDKQLYRLGLLFHAQIA